MTLELLDVRVIDCLEGESVPKKVLDVVQKPSSDLCFIEYVYLLLIVLKIALNLSYLVTIQVRLTTICPKQSVTVKVLS
jgi:hypothetical protein